MHICSIKRNSFKGRSTNGSSINGSCIKGGSTRRCSIKGSSVKGNHTKGGSINGSSIMGSSIKRNSIKGRSTKKRFARRVNVCIGVHRCPWVCPCGCMDGYVCICMHMCIVCICICACCGDGGGGTSFIVATRVTKLAKYLKPTTVAGEVTQLCALVLSPIPWLQEAACRVLGWVARAASLPDNALASTRLKKRTPATRTRCWHRLGTKVARQPR